MRLFETLLQDLVDDHHQRRPRILGLLGSMAVTQFMSKLLYGVRATDPATFGAVALLLATVAALASFLPARRATERDPALALRND